MPLYPQLYPSSIPDYKLHPESDKVGSDVALTGAGAGLGWTSSQSCLLHSTPGLPDSLHLEATVKSGLHGQREKLQKMRSVFDQDWADWLTDWYDTSDITLSFT